MSQDKDHSQARASASYSARLRGGAISRGLTWLLQLGTGGYDPATRHRLMIMNAIAYLIAFTTAGYAVQHAQFDYNKFEPIILLNVALVAVALLVPLSHRVSDIAGGLVIVVTEWVALLLFTMYLGRHAGLHLQYFAGAAAPFVVFGLNRIRLVLLTVVSGLALHIYAWFSFPPGRALIDAGDDVLNPLYYQAAISTAVLIAATVWYAFRLAEDAKAETDALLRNILPDSIVERLKARPDAVIADTHANVTVMFADISGFVALSRKLGPDRVVDLLNDIVRQFDRLAVHHGIEKIKTIGDAYMAVAGVPQPCADAAQRSVTMARDMMKVIADVREAQSVDLHIRVGLASGPVLAGVIGTQKFSYDVWGDTVNLASRMEGASERGRILICPATHEQLGDVFALEEREPIEIKGVGPLKTWFVAESRSAAPVS